MSIPYLIANLKTGFNALFFRTLRNRPDLAIKELERLTPIMQHAAESLRESQIIIAGLVSDCPTFAMREAAYRWVLENTEVGR